MGSSAVSNFRNIPLTISQESIVGSIWFIIFIAELFFIDSDVGFVSYAVDTTTCDLQHLAIEIFRGKMDISKQIMN